MTPFRLSSLRFSRSSRKRIPVGVLFGITYGLRAISGLIDVLFGNRLVFKVRIAVRETTHLGLSLFRRNLVASCHFDQFLKVL